MSVEPTGCPERGRQPSDCSAVSAEVSTYAQAKALGEEALEAKLYRLPVDAAAHDQRAAQFIELDAIAIAQMQARTLPGLERAQRGP